MKVLVLVLHYMRHFLDGQRSFGCYVTKALGPHPHCRWYEVFRKLKAHRSTRCRGKSRSLRHSSECVCQTKLKQLPKVRSSGL